MVHGACVGDGVGDLDFVGPPVGEDGGADGVLFDDLGDLVGLEPVLEGADLKAELLGDAAEHEDLVLAVGVAVDESVAGEDLGESFEFEVAGEVEYFASKHSSFFVLFLSRDPVSMFISTILAKCFISGFYRILNDCVLTGFGEAVAHGGFDAHAGLGVAGGVVVAPVGLFDIFAQRELDAGLCALEVHVLWFGTAPAEFDGFGLSAHRVCRAVEELCGGEPAGEFAVEADVSRVEGVFDAALGGDGLSGFVDAEAEETGVGVGVDEAGGDVFASGVDGEIDGDLWIGTGSELADLAVADDDPCVFEDAVDGLCPDGGVVDQDGILGRDFIEGVGAEGGWGEVGERVGLACVFVVCFGDFDGEGVLVGEIADASHALGGVLALGVVDGDGEDAGRAEGGVIEGELEAVVVGVERFGDLGDVLTICVLDDGDGVFGDLEGELELVFEDGVPGADEVVDGEWAIDGVGGPVEWGLVCAESGASHISVVEERA